jgi:hypothetical protein
MGPFLKKVVLILIVLVLAVVVFSILGGDGGTLDFAYEGFD